MTVADTERFGRLFDLFDFDGDGVISREDLTRMGGRLIEAFALPPGSPKAVAYIDLADRLWNEMVLTDADGSGTISRTEYVAAVSDPDGNPALGEDTLGELLRPALDLEFALADTDDDGQVNRAEFTTLLVAYGLSEADADTAFTRLDLDDSGTLTKVEYSQAWLDFATGRSTGAAWMLGPPA